MMKAAAAAAAAVRKTCPLARSQVTTRALSRKRPRPTSAAAGSGKFLCTWRTREGGEKRVVRQHRDKRARDR